MGLPPRDIQGKGNYFNIGRRFERKSIVFEVRLSSMGDMPQGAGNRSHRAFLFLPLLVRPLVTSPELETFEADIY